MKITGTRSYIEVEVDGKVVKISGEMTVGGFVAFKDSIKQWQVPKNEPIDSTVKNELIEKIIQKTKDSHMIITFE
ncbi:Imm74 family immunity protein [Caproiciproducens galactitolivorans]|uniref:Imm74 family immunity protein n=1 Tax=Caproiciproducens galactitolivorans TaxID=642589 RepID=A0ABT4BVE5_9FIRM|nr:Imm74 family immunity protein [Caproiciproducens galactitolivorans]MCY1714750.1 Imm74 family immunity protein [Caproiciproducens galactitolivorans]